MDMVIVCLLVFFVHIWKVITLYDFVYFCESVDGKHPGCDEYYFGRREFSFTLENDVYLRYKSFKNASVMEDAIKSNFPYKIDIGAVYSVDVSRKIRF